MQTMTRIYKGYIWDQCFLPVTKTKKKKHKNAKTQQKLLFAPMPSVFGLNYLNTIRTLKYSLLTSVWKPLFGTNAFYWKQKLKKQKLLLFSRMPHSIILQLVTRSLDFHLKLFNLGEYEVILRDCLNSSKWSWVKTQNSIGIVILLNLGSMWWINFIVCL